MDIVEISKIDKDEARKSMEVFSEISFYGNNGRKLEQLIDKVRDTEALLKTINLLGQGIEQINIAERTYRHFGKNISLNQLSRGEKVFLAAYAATESHTHIAIRYDIFQLTKTNIKIFFQVFGDSDYITIITENNDDYVTLKMYLEEAGK